MSDYLLEEVNSPVGKNSEFSEVIRSYDFDGTLTTGQFSPKVDLDIVLTGRTFNEAKYVNAEITKLGCEGIAVFFNPLSIKVRGNGTTESRTVSAMHKIDILTKLSATHDVTHYDDDELQLNLIKRALPHVRLVKISRADGVQTYYADTSGKSW